MLCGTEPHWPDDRDKALRVVDDLIALQNQGLPIRNSRAQLDAMKKLFQGPGWPKAGYSIPHGSRSSRALFGHDRFADTGEWRCGDLLASIAVRQHQAA